MPDRIEQTYAIPQGQPVNVPVFYASGCSLQASPNDVTLLLSDTIPVAGSGGDLSRAQVVRPVLMIKLSPQSAKDIASALTNAIQQYERAYKTTIVTETMVASE